MKKLLIAMICIAAFAPAAHTQRLQPVISIKKPIKPLVLEATDYLHVPVPFQYAEWKAVAELYNEQGKLVIKTPVDGTMITMYTGDLPPGRYELRIVWFGGTVIFPVMKYYVR